MYNVNYLKRPVLIMPDEVIFHAATDQASDSRYIQQNIIVAEERFIAPAIGDTFYEELITLKNQYVTSDNQAAMLVLVNSNPNLKAPLTLSQLPIGSIINAIEFVTNPYYVGLWNRFLWKLTAEAVDMMAIVPSWLRATAQGQMMNNPATIGGNGQNSESGKMADVKFKMDKAIQDRIDPLIERMRLYIYKRNTSFPTFRNNGDCDWYNNLCSCHDPKIDGVSSLRKTGIIFGAYDDVDRENRRGGYFRDDSNY